MEREIGLYIHIPFCMSKCYYCDFNSGIYSKEIISEYFTQLYNELLNYSKKYSKIKIKSIYIGGGTPSFVDIRYIESIVHNISKYFQINNNAEISIETNPGTLNREKLIKYRNLGINRISIGLQVWQNKLLKVLGRSHTNLDFTKSIENIIDVGFKNFNVDIMFGIPTQNLEDVNETLQNVVKFSPTHLSCYSLKVEENTKLDKMIKSNSLNQISDSLDREMYYMIIDFLKDHSYFQYEISNFSKKDYECKHNLLYWESEEYIGVGVSASSYFNKERYTNISSLKDYIYKISNNQDVTSEREIIDLKEEIKEKIILSLRMNKGLNITEFNQKFETDFINTYQNKIRKLVNNNLIILDKNFIRLTNKGFDLANQVFVEFI